jgi:RNA polymerase sigma-70 factor (ECF subfamily)
MWLLAALARMRPAAESQAEDVACLQRLAGGDDSAAAGLYDRHARPVYSLILRIVGEESEAEDVLQEVFAQAFRQTARYDASRGPVAAWLLMMARSRSIDRVRARRARPDARTPDAYRVIDETPAAMPDAASAMLDAEHVSRGSGSRDESGGAEARSESGGWTRRTDICPSSASPRACRVERRLHVEGREGPEDGTRS